jgi:hypothetical protein
MGHMSPDFIAVHGLLEYFLVCFLGEVGKGTVSRTSRRHTCDAALGDRLEESAGMGQEKVSS